MSKRRILRRMFCAAILMGVCFLASVFPARAEDELKPQINGQNTDKWILSFQEEFDGERLDSKKFSDQYLPHWSTKDVTANYVMKDGKIRLLIDQNQPGWMENTKQQVSGIQTGMKDGLHVWNRDLEISGHYPAVDNYSTQYGYFELRARAQKGGGVHSAWWMIGDQHKFDKSAEVDIFEILGKDVNSNKSRIRVTIHPWDDTMMWKQRMDYRVDGDVSAEYHTYGLEWLPTGMKWYYDGNLVRETSQSPDYKMYTLLGIYQSWGSIFSWQGPVDESVPHPKSFDIDYFRVYKTREMLDEDEKEKQEILEEAETEPSIGAIFGGDFTWIWEKPPGHLNDNDLNTTLQSRDDVTFPVSIYVDFQEARTVNGLSLYTHYGQGQGVTDFVIEYQDEITKEWREAGRIDGYQWKANSTVKEELRYNFPEPVTAKALRVVVLKANMKWRHFAINEIRLWNIEN